MATPVLKTPKEFHFNKPEEWGKWKARFQQYRLASGLSEKSAECQIGTLLYCMGEEAEDVLDATGISDADKSDYKKVLDKFDDHFQVRKNLIYERARFNQRKQEKGESVELFITALHQIVDICEFGTMKDELIRDRLVVGIRDKTLSERLQMEGELTLEKAKRLIRQREAVKEQGSALKSSGAEDSHSLESVASKHQRRRFKAHSVQSDQRSRAPPTSNKCRRCGGESHPLQRCPAKEVVCHKCNRKGHFRKHCLSKTVAAVTGDRDQSPDGEEPDFYLDTTSLDDASETTWQIEVLVGDNKMNFKVDTGAEVTAMSHSAWKSLRNVPQLHTSKKVLGGPDWKPLSVIREAIVPFTYKQKSCDQTVYVIKNLKNNLLGLPAIRALNILQQVDAVETPIPEKYPQVLAPLVRSTPSS